MPDHLHLIAQSNGKEHLSAVLRDLKKQTAKEITKGLKSLEDNESGKALEIFANEGRRLKRIKKSLLSGLFFKYVIFRTCDAFINW
ncbi:MAG TPA: hypothetical protein PKW80_11975 [Bacteroidales bacterium]|nr:hypothetical protein [Bacteroidales bacterium]